MRKENITYRELSRGEICKFGEIDRSEIVEDVYYFRDGKLVLEKEFWDVKGFYDSLPVRINKLTGIYDNGGTPVGAFDGENLVGLGCIGGKLIGEDGNIVQLTTLFVSCKYRDRGIGGQIVSLLKEKARRAGAEKLYVSATPSRHTVEFYRNAGFDLTTPVRELFEEEPEDIHMAMLL